MRFILYRKDFRLVSKRLHLLDGRWSFPQMHDTKIYRKLLSLPFIPKLEKSRDKASLVGTRRPESEHFYHDA